jgi:hypothetical protein
VYWYNLSGRFNELELVTPTPLSYSSLIKNFNYFLLILRLFFLIILFLICNLFFFFLISVLEGRDGEGIDGEGIDGEGIDGEGIDGDGSGRGKNHTYITSGSVLSSRNFKKTGNRSEFFVNSCAEISTIFPIKFSRFFHKSLRNSSLKPDPTFTSLLFADWSSRAPIWSVYLLFRQCKNKF